MDDELRLVMCKGLPASGKTSRAVAHVLQQPAGAWVRINKDSLREMLHGGRFHGKTTERQVVGARDVLVWRFLGDGVSVVVDDTNLSPAHEAKLRAAAAEHHAVFEVWDFTDVPFEVCVERDAARTGGVGEEVIRKMWERYLQPAGDTR